MSLRGLIAVRNSDDPLEDLKLFHGKACHIMSLDIKDIYHSLKKDLLICRQKNLREACLVSFQSGARIAVDDFLCLVDLYVSSTAVSWDGELFVQA